MIVKMKRYAFLVYHKEYSDFLEDIQKLGVVHVREKASGVPTDEALDTLLKTQGRLTAAINVLKKRQIVPLEPQDGMDAQWVLETVEGIGQEIEVKKNELQIIDKERALLQPWGEFSWELIDRLKEAGQYLHFFSVQKSKYQNQWAESFAIVPISEEAGHVYFVVITDTPGMPEIDADPVRLPRKTIRHLEEQRNTNLLELEGLNHSLDQIAGFGIEKLQKRLQTVYDHSSFEQVRLNTEIMAENRIMLLEGWVPDGREEGLVDLCYRKQIYFTKSKPILQDQVPILLKNNSFARLFEMIGSLYSLPNYHEIDLTPFFAPFFMLFFGFCLGDAGYGLLMMVATLFLRKKAKPAMKAVWTLGFLFGISTTIMGIIGGTFFGILLMDLHFTWLEAFKSIMLDQNQLMYLSLGLGVLQIVFGMVLKAARHIKMNGLRYALSTIGWIVVIVGVGGSYGLSAMKWIDSALAQVLMLTFGLIGGVLVLFFNSPGKNIMVNFGLGLWDTYGTASGFLGDVLSYVRLFALGLSSAVLGSVFNKLAFDLSGDTIILKQLVIVLILLVGHTINFFMAALGSFVHPLRLTFVEFYKNTGFEGGGRKYSPFGHYEEVNK